VIERQPRNPVGWILAWVAIMSAIPDLAAGYGAYALYGPGLPGGVWAAWLFSFTYAWALGAAGTVLFLFLPDGRPPSPAWRPVAAFPVIAVAAFSASYAVIPAPIPIFEVDRPFALANDSAALVLFSLSTVALFFAIIASVASLFVRARRATSVEKQQLKWL